MIFLLHKTLEIRNKITIQQMIILNESDDINLFE